MYMLRKIAVASMCRVYRNAVNYLPFFLIRHNPYPNRLIDGIRDFAGIRNDTNETVNQSLNRRKMIMNYKGEQYMQISVNRGEIGQFRTNFAPMCLQL